MTQPLHTLSLKEISEIHPGDIEVRYTREDILECIRALDPEWPQSFDESIKYPAYILVGKAARLLDEMYQELDKELLTIDIVIAG